MITGNKYMSNAIYLCCTYEPWANVIRRLADEGVRPALVFVWRDELTKYSAAFGSSTTLETVEDGWRGRFGVELSKTVIMDKCLINEYSSEILVALKMMDRLDPSGILFSTDDRFSFIVELIERSIAIISSQEIDLVISPSIPHRVFDFAFYIASKILGVKFIAFQMTPFGSYIIPVENIEKMPPLKNSCNEHDRLPKVIQERIEKVLGGYDKAIPSYMVKHIANDRFHNRVLVVPFKKILRAFSSKSYYKFSKPNTYWVGFSSSPFGNDVGWIEYFLIKLMARIRQRKNYKFYRKIVTKDIDKSKRYCLVALHYQPEETTCPSGGVYADQSVIVRMLDAVLPHDVDIYVKEHKAQFYKYQEGAAGRSINFYRRLKSLSKRVTFLSLDEDPFQLIDSAEFVVTVSGTIGWESALRRIPVAVFGRAWYEGMPGVSRIEGNDDLVHFIEHLDDIRNSISETEIYRFHQLLHENMIQAVHYKAAQGNTDISMKESEVNLSGFIKNQAFGC